MNQNRENPRRGFLVKMLTLGWFGAIHIDGMLQPSHARGDISDELPPGQSIFKLNGSVFVDGHSATLKTRIGPDSRIQTGDDSQVIFVVAREAFILRSNSEIQMHSADGALLQGLRILSGRLLSVFGQRQEPRTMTTPTATIGIRGTGVYVESDPEKTYFCTCYGNVRISANANPDVTRDIVAERHDEPVYILPQAKDAKLIRPAPVINHSDTELMLIEALVGRKPPFGSGGGYGVPRKREY